MLFPFLCFNSDHRMLPALPPPPSMGVLGISVLNLVRVGSASSFWQAAVAGGLASAHVQSHLALLGAFL